MNPKYTRKLRKFWITTPKVSGEVHVDARGQICKVPPAWNRLLRQPLFSLTGWLRNCGAMEIEELPSEAGTKEDSKK